MTTQLRLLAAVGVAIALAPAAALAQERGSITGTVVDEATERPLVGVQITIAGTQLGALTNQDGRYLIRNVPAGTRQVRASRIGFTQAAQDVTVEPGEVATADFRLAISAIALEGVVITAMGELQRVRERGNVVAQIPVADMDLAPVNTMSDVLQGRAAGVVVQRSGGTTGTGARVRVRGSASASLGNQPLIIVDGIRVNDGPNSLSFGIGGQSPSRLEDLNPEEIENIEILKGPAAAALYGTAAATGVIQITTRRGHAGATRWHVYSEAGLLHERNQWPGNYRMMGLTPDGAEIPCWTWRAAAGVCTPTEMLSWNPLMDRRQGNGVSNPALGPASPFRDGRRQHYGMNVSGGSETVTYFLAGDFEDEKGVFLNNNLDRVSLRANVRSQLRDDLDVTVTSGWISSDAQLPWNDNAIGGLISDAITGSFMDDPDRRGYSLTAPETMARVDTRQGLRRLIGSVNANYRPLHWLTLVGTAGLDVVNRHDNEVLPPETLPFGDLPDGRRISNRIEISNYTATLGATATRELTPTIVSTSSLGAQYHQEVFRGTFATGWELLAGTGSLQGTNARFAVNETNQDVIQVGAFFQQQFAYRDRVFLTGALRGDDNSTFGADFGLIWYPSVSLSWVASEEAWFPRLGPINSLRLRGAFGRSGLRPGFRQAHTYYTPVPATVDGRDATAFTVGGVGDPELSPEISTELETGFDLGLFDDRVGFEITYYDKTSREALVARRLAPSLGMSLTRFENIGEVNNRGIEALINARIVDRPSARWNATLSVGTNRNRLVEMDGDPIIFGLAAGQRHTEGFPLGGYWQRSYTYNDHDGSGLLRLQDVVMSDTMEYAGQPFPTRNIALNTDVTLFDRVRIAGMVEHQGGHTVWSSTDEWQCVFLLCRDLNDPNTPLDLQARGIGTWAYFSWWGYLEDASFTKLRELSLTYIAPERWARRFGADALSVTLAGRNLATWTNYTGLDPEVNFAGQDNFTTAEFQSLPPLRHWTARVNVNF